MVCVLIKICPLFECAIGRSVSVMKSHKAQTLRRVSLSSVWRVCRYAPWTLLADFAELLEVAFDDAQDSQP